MPVSACCVFMLTLPELQYLCHIDAASLFLDSEVNFALSVLVYCVIACLKDTTEILCQ